MTHYYRFEPDIYGQSNPYRCWAASLACWLNCIYRSKGKVTTGTWTGQNATSFKTFSGSAWRRDILSEDEIVDQYSPNLMEDGGLKKRG